jgi:flavin-dependent dehydrogenase
MSTTDRRSYETVNRDAASAADVAIIGGGPAGATAARLLARRGHRVMLFASTPDPVRAFTESLPPSVCPLLTTLGVLDAMDENGFIRSYGNTVWWAGRERGDERFGDDETFGFQVFRPRFDAMMLDHAAAAGAVVTRGATVREVSASGGGSHGPADGDGLALQVRDRHGEVHTVRARFVLDCSGRAGVMARRHRIHEPALRGQALIGLWRAPRWPVRDAGHTLVESWADGWGWSVPAGDGVRHVGMLVDGGRTGVERGAGIESTYRTTLARMRHLQALVSDAVLERAWACDASVYASRVYGGGNYLLVGDAASFIEPLSSFGVKKALASGWMAAVAAHTMLRHPERRNLALEFFSDWERRVYGASVERSQRYAREALARYERPFWQARAAITAPVTEAGEDDLLAGARVRQTFECMRSAPTYLRVASTLAVVPRPVIRDGTVVPEDAILLPDDTRAIRFVRGIDVLVVTGLARAGIEAGTLIARYVERFGSQPLPDLLAAIALLVERRVLIAEPLASSTKT